MKYLLILYVMFAGEAEPRADAREVPSPAACLEAATAFMTVSPADIGAVAIGVQCISIVDPEAVKKDTDA